MTYEVDEKIETAGDRALKREKKQRMYYTKIAVILSFVAVVLFIVFSFFLYRRIPIGGSGVEINVVDLNEFKAHLDISSDPVVVDIRQKYEFEASHLPQAVWGEKNRCLEYGVETCSHKACTEKQEYFFYSDHGEEYNEVQNAIKETRSRGCWTAVWLLDGGFKDWQKAGYDVVK